MATKRLLALLLFPPAGAALLANEGAGNSVRFALASVGALALLLPPILSGLSWQAVLSGYAVFQAGVLIFTLSLAEVSPPAKYTAASYLEVGIVGTASAGAALEFAILLSQSVFSVSPDCSHMLSLASICTVMAFAFVSFGPQLWRYGSAVSLEIDEARGGRAAGGSLLLVGFILALVTSLLPLATEVNLADLRACLR
jgi:hypothetical protein